MLIEKLATISFEDREEFFQNLTLAGKEKIADIAEISVEEIIENTNATKKTYETYKFWEWISATFINGLLEVIKEMLEDVIKDEPNITITFDMEGEKILITCYWLTNDIYNEAEEKKVRNKFVQILSEYFINLKIYNHLF